METNKLIGFSIIVTAYNMVDYIENALDSIETQSYFRDNVNFEVLLGIDGCEKTLEKVKDIKDKYRNLTVYYMHENKGTYITSNTLIQKTKYKNIIRFDSDDIMKPNMIQEASKYVNDYELIRFTTDDFIGDITHIQDRHIHGGCICVDYKIFDILGGYRPWLCNADTDFFMRILGHARGIKIKVVQEVTIYRRRHDNSLTRSPHTGMESALRKSYMEESNHNLIKYQEFVVHDNITII